MKEVEVIKRTRIMRREAWYLDDGEWITRFKFHGWIDRWRRVVRMRVQRVRVIWRTNRYIGVVYKLKKLFWLFPFASNVVSIPHSQITYPTHSHVCPLIITTQQSSPPYFPLSMHTPCSPPLSLPLPPIKINAFLPPS